MSKTKGLGKGLDALIPPTPEEGEAIFMCPVDAISAFTDQPRRRFDPDKLNELVQTIREKGVLSPVIVRSAGEGYQLISGERRWRAAKQAGLERVPAMLREVSDREALELSLIENLQREDLTPLEEARALQKLLELYGTSQEELATRLGKDRSTISNTLRLLKLSTPIQDALEGGVISAGHARCLLSVPQALQEKLLHEIVTRDLSVRSTEKLAKRFSDAHGSPEPASPPASIELEAIRARIRAILATQVRIIEGKRKGKIVIEYYTREDLNRIVQLFTSLGR